MLRRLAIALLSGLFLATLLPSSVARQPSVENEELQFRLPDLDGKIVDLSDPGFAGKVLLVSLWATWCPPCLTEIPTLIEMQDQYRDRGLVIVAIAFESDEPADSRRDRLREFGRKRGINYLVLDGGLPEEFEHTLPGVKNVRGLPVEILIDRAGHVSEARNSYGNKKGWAEKLKREIEALLEGPETP